MSASLAPLRLMSLPSSGRYRLAKVLQALPGAPIGNVDLIAPVGTVDAGDADIRSSGNVNIAAVVVLNAFNIQAGGNVTGVPVVTAPNIGALTSANSVAGASQATVPTTTGSANNNNQRSIIIVEVIGFGGSDGTTPSQDNAQGRKEKDQRSYNTNSPYQILGVGALNDR